MRGLTAIPSLQDLRRAYAALQGAGPASEADYARWSQWSRFDPRLGEIWVERFAREWKALRPAVLREALLAEPWPQAFGVLVEQAASSPQISRPEAALLRRFSRLVLHGVPLAGFESFFIGLSPLASKSLLEDASGSLRSYLRWGYFGREVLLNKAQSQLRAAERGITQVPARTRRRELERLIAQQDRITIEDYRERLGWGVSPRVAQLDLQAHPRLRAVGRTRGRFYRRVG